MLTIYDRIRSRWQTFSYNFGWSSYVGLLDGWIPRLSLAVPIVGYLILFNDSVVQHLTFQELTSGRAIFGLSGGARLKFIYVGLILLGFANIIYRWKRPYPLRFGIDQFSYVETGLRNFTLETFIQFHGEIRHSGRGHFTQHGKYYDADWDAFFDHAAGKDTGNKVIGRDPTTGHWVEAKSKYEGLLRSILTETFFREDTRTRRIWLVLCLSIAAVGYALLSIPSVDLFIKVMSAIIAPVLNTAS